MRVPLNLPPCRVLAGPRPRDRGVRATTFFGSVSGGLIALGLVATATQFGTASVFLQLSVVEEGTSAGPRPRPAHVRALSCGTPDSLHRAYCPEAPDHAPQVLGGAREVLRG